MGGRSTSTFKVEAGKGVFSGVCRIVPALKAPGFCNAEARPALGQKIADASAFIDGGLEIVLTSTGNLTQFKAAFGNKAEHDFGSFKADFTVTKGPNTVRIPFVIPARDSPSTLQLCLVSRRFQRTHSVSRVDISADLLLEQVVLEHRRADGQVLPGE